MPRLFHPAYRTTACAGVTREPPPNFVFPAHAGIQRSYTGSALRWHTNLAECGKVQYLSALLAWLQFQDSDLSQAAQLLRKGWATGIHHENVLELLNHCVVGVAEDYNVDGGIEHSLKRTG